MGLLALSTSHYETAVFHPLDPCADTIKNDLQFLQARRSDFLFQSPKESFNGSRCPIETREAQTLANRGG